MSTEERERQSNSERQTRKAVSDRRVESVAQPVAPAVEEAQRVELTINGQTVEAWEGMTLLQAAQSVGISIPTLCHHKELSSYGACRLCSVEVVRGRRSRIVASCIYPVEDGIEVLTESEKVVKHRKVILELILSRWPWVDKELLEKYGVQPGRFEEKTDFCILCGLCVRYCSEVKKADCLGFVGRGAERQVVIYPERAMEICPNCDGGKMGCRSVCPTGTIPNEFAHTGPRFGKKLPLAYPVKSYSEDNVREVLHTVGDWRMPWVRSQTMPNK
jgi:predicted molibdopterin-dependent oxidoreductase YjgC